MTADPLFSFQLPRLLLRAMALFQHDERAALKCASFEIRAHGKHHELTIVTCDGRRLATYQTEIAQDTLFGELPRKAQFVIDLVGCARLPKVEGVSGDQVTIEVFEKHIEIAADRIRYTAQRLESEINYPSWRGIVPAGEPESLTQFAVNHELLADFGKVAKALSREGQNLALRSFGPDRPIAVLLPTHREFFGLIMPLKFENAEAVPEWLREALAAPSKEKPDTAEQAAA
jgi:hypothetical protein